MFSLKDIEFLHSQIKSWADFPKYIKDLKNIWVVSYDFFVIDGKSKYFWKNNFFVEWEWIYEKLKINSEIKKDEFIKILQIHQSGWSDFMDFCMQSARCGIAKWIMNLEDLTCSYLDNIWNVVLVEKIGV